MPAKQKRSHGTEIILRNLLPRTKAELSSADHWKALLTPQNEDGNGTVSYPMYHIGCIQPDDPGEFLVPPELPWGQETDPDKRFRLFTARMFERADEAGLRRPSLDNTFDNYFKFLWFLSLSAPLDYLDKHPFDLDGSSGIRVFQLSNSKEGRATELSLKQRLTVRETLGLKSPERGTNLEFRVLVDGVSLKRPIRFADLPKSRHSVDRPLLFVGQDRPDLSKHPETIRGGDLEFEGYLLWCPRVIPVEHNGVLVRVNDASGTLFDKTFMKYQVSELLRLQQVSSELFVTEGLDAALSIDRESFNIAHPHYQYIASWVHNAFKQFATRHKDLAQGARTTRRATEAAQSQQVLVREVSSIVDRLTKGDEDPMTVEFAEPLPASAPGKRADVVTYSLEKVFERYAPGSRATPKKALEFEHDQAVMRGVAQVLYASGVFDRMGHEQQEQLLADLAAVIFVGRGA